MPKQKITKEMVVDTAFELVREEGREKLLVKNVANRLNCSVQPIYSYCGSMEGLQKEVEDRVAAFVREYVASHVKPGDFFKSIGRAYIQLAQEEPELFRMFVFQKKDSVDSLDTLFEREVNSAVTDYVAEIMGISRNKAQEVYKKILIFNMGIWTILATATPGAPPEELVWQLDEACDVFLNAALL